MFNRVRFVPPCVQYDKISLLGYFVDRPTISHNTDNINNFVIGIPNDDNKGNNDCTIVTGVLLSQKIVFPLN